MARIVTGYEGRPHIQAEDWQELNRCIFGIDRLVISREVNGPTKVGNVVTLPAMELMLEGVHCRIDGSESVEIPWTVSGKKRYDRIVGIYEKSSEGIESFRVGLLSGTASSNPIRPELPTGHIFKGDNVAHMGLYTVLVNGTSSISIEQDFEENRGIPGKIRELIDDILRVDLALNRKITEVDQDMKQRHTDARDYAAGLNSMTVEQFRAADTNLKEELNNKINASVQTLERQINTDMEVVKKPFAAFGKAAAIPAGIGTKTTLHVDFTWQDSRRFASAPVVVITPNATKPNTITSYSVTNITKTGFDIIFYRSEKVETNFGYIAYGTK